MRLMTWDSITEHQTACGTQPACYTFHTSGCSLAMKWPECELAHSAPVGSKVNKGVALYVPFIGAKAFVKLPALYIIRDVHGIVVNRSSESGR